MVACCLGPSFDVETMQRATKDQRDVNSFLDACVERGYLNRKGISGISPEYSWQHDQIRQAASDLIPAKQHESIHLLIGTRLYMRTPTSELDRFIFVIVDSMNEGKRLLQNAEQRYDLVSLNLKAGESLISSSAFSSSVHYIMTGMSLLDSSSWSDRYDLTIRVYNVATVRTRLSFKCAEVLVLNPYLDSLPLDIVGSHVYYWRFHETLQPGQ